MNESKFYRHLKTHFLNKIPGFYYDRLESSVSSNGLPDIVYTYSGHHGFIELKYHDKPIDLSKNFNLSHSLSASQILFLVTRGMTGGNCWLIIGTPESCLFIHSSKLNAYMVLEAYTWGELMDISDRVVPMGNFSSVLENNIL